MEPGPLCKWEKKKKKKKKLRCGALLVLARADSHVAGDCACSLMTSHDGFGGLYCREQAIDYDINLIQAELKLHLMSSSNASVAG